MSEKFKANFKDGIIRDGDRVGSGDRLGNIKKDIIRIGNSSYAGNGDRIGNIKDDIIREGNSSYAGNGDRILNIKDGIVREGNSSYTGNGNKIGKVEDFAIVGMERELDADMVACYHFLVKKIC